MFVTSTFEDLAFILPCNYNHVLDICMFSIVLLGQPQVFQPYFCETLIDTKIF